MSTPTTGGAFVVLRRAAGYYVIAVSEQEDDLEPRGLQLPASRRTPSARDNILDELGLGSVADNAIEVSEEWLALFPAGRGPSTLGSFGLEGLGDRAAERA